MVSASHNDPIIVGTPIQAQNSINTCHALEKLKGLLNCNLISTLSIGDTQTDLQKSTACAWLVSSLNFDGMELVANVYARSSVYT